MSPASDVRTGLPQKHFWSDRCFVVVVVAVTTYSWRQAHHHKSSEYCPPSAACVSVCKLQLSSSQASSIYLSLTPHAMRCASCCPTCRSLPWLQTNKKQTHAGTSSQALSSTASVRGFTPARGLLLTGCPVVNRNWVHTNWAVNTNSDWVPVVKERLQTQYHHSGTFDGTVTNCEAL